MLKQVSVFCFCLAVIAGVPVPVRSQHEAAFRQPAGNQAKSFTFDDHESLAGWKIEGDVTIDVARGRRDNGHSLKVGPGGMAFIKLRDSDESGRVEVWIYDDGTTPENAKDHRVGPRWGLLQSDGRVLAVGILYASYLGGDEGYTATACDGRQWHDRLFWLGVRRAPAGWHKWTFDFDPEVGLQVFHNDRQVNAVDSRKTGLKGFSAFAVWGDEEKGREQTIWLSGLSVKLGGPVVVPPTVEADPYEEKAIAAEMAKRRPVTVYTKDNVPAAPGLEDLPLKGNVSQYGITWSFHKPARVGQFVNGDWYVVGPVTINAIDPRPLYGSEIPKRELDGMDRERKEEHRVRNGFMLNPPAKMEVAYDSGVRNWFTPSLIQKLPVAMKPGDSLVSTISMPKNLVLHAQLRNKIERGVDDSSPIRTAAVLTCVGEPQPMDAFRPAFCDRQQKIYLARNLKRELLPTADATESVPKIRKYIRFTQRPWVGTCFFGFEEPVENMPQYGLEYGRVAGISALLLCTGLESQQKEPLLINLVQVGIDLGGMVRAGHPGWTGWGGHGSGRKLPIVFAGLLLGDDELANINRSFPKVSFGEDEQTAYGDCWTGAKVVFAGHSGIDAATGEGRSRGNDWGPYEHLPPSQWGDGQNTSESYRRCCTSVGWVAQALALRLMHAESFWSHDAFFDYVDRWMYEDDSAFVKTIKESTGRDHDKEWARQGQAWDTFVNEMWARHRPRLPAPTDGWKQKHDGASQRTSITEQSAVSLPPGVKAVWDLSKAYREATATRERVCINGLWQWQPAEGRAEQVPDGNWGYFKVPGCWPGITDYMQKDCQRVYAHPSWKSRNMRSVTAAWYQRQITVPDEWAGWRVTISAEYLNSHAAVYVDGKNMGNIIFPGGEVDVTSACRPGGTHVLSMFVAAMPLKGVMLSYKDTGAARKVTGSVARRGLCGDMYLVSTPKGARIADVKVDTSVRKWEITFESELSNLSADAQYVLRGRVSENDRSVQEFTSKPFKGSDLTNGRFAFTEKWKPEKLWDIHTPQNQYDVTVSLLEASGRVLDVSEQVRFGFREFWIDGRDFLLNGSRIFLSSVPLDNAQVGAAWANYAAARESMERLKSFGINFVYTHNYGCEPGTHLSFTEVLTAADDIGMLVSFSQPHFGQYDWESPDADKTNGYARHAQFYVRAAQNHPSVVFYSMSHNSTGYNEDMNPDMIDGIQNPRDTWSLRNSRRASRAAAIVSDMDPGRVIYHHSSGNLGPMHTSNFYANFAPIQEISDWFEHWSTVGVKPVFTCEYSVPFPWDWTMYRGWYQGKRSFGSARVPWEFCLSEWNSQFLGDEAFKLSEMEKTNLRWEARQFRAGSLWHRWDYPHPVGSSGFSERQPVYAMYFTDNWRAFRTWGVSAISPWNHGHYWTLRESVDKNRKEFQVDWENLQRPGFSPDYIEQRYERMDLAFEKSDWIPTIAAQALVRNNRPLLAYIAGKPGSFTSKDHNFLPGETVEKQLIVINNSRESVTCNCQWSLDLPRTVEGQRQVIISTGQQQRVPLRFQLPATLTDGKYDLKATFKFGNGGTQTDSFTIHVMLCPQIPRVSGKIALFDPNGQTEKLLKDMGIMCHPIKANTDLSAYDVLIVGKSALTVEGRSPDISHVRDGLKVLMFEQTPDVLEKRLGFRVAEYGLQWVFKRVPDHPLLTGIADEYLRDWRGEATILPPRLDYKLDPRFNGAPTVNWCGIPVTRLWRCGNRGNVTSVLIEKPAKGDFVPILDGGYSLQYSPLMEYRQGKGVVLFCQMDITGRTEDDPAARTLAGNILRYVSTWKPAPRREVVYIGDSAGRRHLESAGISLKSYEGANLSAGQVLVVGPGGEQRLATDTAAIAKWLKAGGSLLAIGLNEQQINAFLPLKVSTKEAEHIAAYFEPFSSNSLLVGIGPADVHSREPRKLSLVSAGATVIGDGVLAKVENLNVVFCQFAPWQFDYKELYNLKRTFRRTSYLLTRLLANMEAAGQTRLLERFGTPVDASKGEKRWTEGLYMDTPQEWDDPYRFFRW
jgi:beta-galactosidase